MNLNGALTKAFENKSMKELVDAPVHALQGVSEADAEKLKAAFGVETVSDLGTLKFARWARAIVELAETEE